jgi:hypothetical protein
LGRGLQAVQVTWQRGIPAVDNTNFCPSFLTLLDLLVVLPNLWTQPWCQRTRRPMDGADLPGHRECGEWFHEQIGQILFRNKEQMCPISSRKKRVLKHNP